MHKEEIVMKKNYNIPTVELIAVFSKDVVTTSPVLSNFFDDQNLEYVYNVNDWFGA